MSTQTKQTQTGTKSRADVVCKGCGQRRDGDLRFRRMPPYGAWLLLCRPCRAYYDQFAHLMRQRGEHQMPSHPFHTSKGSLIAELVLAIIVALLGFACAH